MNSSHHFLYFVKILLLIRYLSITKHDVTELYINTTFDIVVFCNTVVAVDVAIRVTQKWRQNHVGVETVLK